MSNASDARIGHSIRPINSFDSFSIPQFEFEDEKYSQTERSVSPQTPPPRRPQAQKRNDTVSRAENPLLVTLKLINGLA